MGFRVRLFSSSPRLTQPSFDISRQFTGGVFAFIIRHLGSALQGSGVGRGGVGGVATGGCNGDRWKGNVGIRIKQRRKQRAGRGGGEAKKKQKGQE